MTLAVAPVLLPPAPSRRRRVARPAAAAALAVVAYGLVWLPYYGDQALYAVIGRDVVAGRPLYGGTWDIKQPGVFLWYGLLDAVAGPSPVVTRVLDVAIAVLTAVLVGRLVGDRVPPRIRRWTPVAAAAVLLLPVRALDLGQVEQLAVLPMVGALLAVLRPGRGRAVAAGVAIGVVAVFKLWLAVVPLAAVAAVLLARRRGAELALVAAGAAVPVAALLAWLGGTGVLGAALDTWFTGPGQLLDQPGVRPVSRLVSGLGRYVLVTAPVLALAGWRLAALVRGRTGGRGGRDPLDLALAAWLAAGLLVIAGQLWWSYHWILLTPALLALAARQVVHVRGRGAALLAVAALPLLAVGVASPERPMAYGNGITAESRAAIDAALGSGPTARAELAAVGVAPGTPIYVLGDPTYQLAAGVGYPARLNGWTPEFFTDAQWDELAADLARTRPPIVFLENIYAELSAVRGNTLLHLLDDQYVQVRSSDAGVWYRITDRTGD